MNNFHNVKIIGFDLDQTLYPKSPEIDKAIQSYLYDKIAILRQIDLEGAAKLFDDLYNGKGLSGSNTMIRLGFPEERAQEIIQEALENADIAKFLIPNQEIIDLLRHLKNKYEHVDLITGSNKHNLNIKLKKLGIRKQIFSKTITADRASKSDLSAFRLWFDYYPNYKPGDFLYIGDRISSDYKKPRELGIKSILVNVEKSNPNIECLQLNSILEIQKYLI